MGISANECCLILAPTPSSMSQYAQVEMQKYVLIDCPTFILTLQSADRTALSDFFSSSPIHSRRKIYKKFQNMSFFFSTATKHVFLH